MTQEYGDAVTKDAIDAAVQLLILLRSQRQSVPLEVLAAEAVASAFCTCVTIAADACGRGRAPTHAGLIAEVGRLAQMRDVESGAALVLIDPIDLASEHSFPASDPPAWIWH